VQLIGTGSTEKGYNYDHSRTKETHTFAEVKSDINKTKADLITQVHNVENKMAYCMSVIREELETRIGNLCAGQTQLEERFDQQQKNVTCIF
jgi:hypothetical protein